MVSPGMVGSVQKRPFHPYRLANAISPEPRESPRFEPRIDLGGITLHNPNSGAERRIAERVKTFQPAELVDADGHSHRVHLLNLSTGGAMIYGRGPGMGAQVHVQGPTPLGEARVAWQRDKYFGVAFAQALPETFIDALISEQRQLVERAAARLGTGPLPAPSR
ncbi:MAG: PilZ domain-containing protein [Sphingomonadales bacterium]|nr:MAG: PilZ domain-containing protein [Sphingomonadales bacterium]